MNKIWIKTIEEDFIELKKDIRCKINSLEMENLKEEEVKYYKDASDFLKDIAPL